MARYDTGQNQYVPEPIDFGPDSDRLFLILYGTGFRNLVDIHDVMLRVGATNMVAAFAGMQAVFPGLDQINAELPRSLAGSGEITIQLEIRGKPANPVTVAFR